MSLNIILALIGTILLAGQLGLEIHRRFFKHDQKT